MRSRWRALSGAQRRLAFGGAVVAAVTVAFTAGALAKLGSDEPAVKVETVSATRDSTTTTKARDDAKDAPKTTTTAEPTTTTTVPPPPETTPPTEPPPPPAPPTYTFEVPGAGTVTVQLDGGVLTVVGVQPFDGWAPETHTGTGTEYVKVLFRHEHVVRWIKVWLQEGQPVPETGEWTECTTTPPATTATYEHPGVGAITVTWNGAAFALDAVTPADGWVVASQEVQADYVRVHFAPEASTETGDEGDGTKWIKVKIHECEIAYFTG
jgi:hypothetical protein